MGRPRGRAAQKKHKVDGVAARALREDQALTLKEAAKRAGLNMLTVRRIELGEELTGPPIRAIAEVYGVDHRDLIVGERDPKARTSSQVEAGSAATARGIDYAALTDDDLRESLKFLTSRAKNLESRRAEATRTGADVSGLDEERRGLQAAIYDAWVAASSRPGWSAAGEDASDPARNTEAG